MANVSVEFVTTTEAKLASLQIKDGQLIALSDKHAMYYDMEGTRHAVTGAVFVGASEDNSGTAGLVPPPDQGSDTRYLSSDGTWKDIPSKFSDLVQDKILIKDDITSKTYQLGVSNGKICIDGVNDD